MTDKFVKSDRDKMRSVFKITVRLANMEKKSESVKSCHQGKKEQCPRDDLIPCKRLFKPYRFIQKNEEQDTFKCKESRYAVETSCLDSELPCEETNNDRTGKEDKE